MGQAYCPFRRLERFYCEHCTVMLQGKLMNRSYRNVCGLMCWSGAVLMFSVGLIQAHRKTLVEQWKAERDRRGVVITAEPEGKRPIEALVNSQVCGIAIVDRHGRIVAWNSAMSRLTGCSIRNAVGNRLSAILCENARRECSQVLGRALASPQANEQPQVVDCELHSRHAAGHQRLVRLSIRAVAAPSGAYAIAALEPQAR